MYIQYHSEYRLHVCTFVFNIFQVISLVKIFIFNVIIITQTAFANDKTKHKIHHLEQQ